MNQAYSEPRFSKNPKRYKIAPYCPCGKDNQDNKFCPIEGYTDKGYCHGCGESFFPDLPPKAYWDGITPAKEKGAVAALWSKREEKPTIVISTEHFEQSVNPVHIQTVRANSSLFQGLLRNKTANIPEARLIEAMNRFYIGYSGYRFTFSGAHDYQSPEGANVFWLVDGQNRIRGGQVVLFDTDSLTCSTVKLPDRHTRPVYLDISRQIKQAGQPVPPWLREYGSEQGNKMPCLFGLPQLQKEPVTKPIAICEAYKTALVGWIYYPEFIWLAIGSKGLLKASRLQEVAGRNVTLWPDLSKDGSTFELWKEKAHCLQKELGGCWSTSTVLENAPDLTAKERDGADLADYLLTRWDWKSFQAAAGHPMV